MSDLSHCKILGAVKLRRSQYPVPKGRIRFEFFPTLFTVLEELKWLGDTRIVF